MTASPSPGRLRSLATPLLLVLLGVLLRVVQLARHPELFLDWEELGRGLVARELLDGMALHLLDHQMDPYAGGSLVMGILVTPFFVLFGDDVISLQLAAIPFIAITALAVWALLRRPAGEPAALLAAALVFLAPYSASRLQLMVWGDHSQVPSFMALCLLLAWGWWKPEGRAPWRAGLLGLVAGFGLYFHYHLAIPLVVVALLLLAADRRALLGSSGLALLGGGLLGFSPWLLYNLTHDFGGLEISRYGSVVDPGVGWFAGTASRLAEILGPVGAGAWGSAPVQGGLQRAVSTVSWLLVLVAWAGLLWADRARLLALGRALLRGRPAPQDEPGSWVALPWLLYLPLFVLLGAISPFDFDNRPWYFADRYLTTLHLAALTIVAMATTRAWSRGRVLRWAGVGLGLWFIALGVGAQWSLLHGRAPGPLPVARNELGEPLRGYDWGLLADERVCSGWYRGDLAPPLRAVQQASGERRQHLARALGCSLAWRDGDDLAGLLARLDSAGLPQGDAVAVLEGLGKGMGTWHDQALADALATMRGHPLEAAFLEGLLRSMSWWFGGTGGDHPRAARLILDSVPTARQHDFLVGLGRWIQESHKGDLPGSLRTATQDLPPEAVEPALQGICEDIAWRLVEPGPRQSALDDASAIAPPWAARFDACLRRAWGMASAPAPQAEPGERWDAIVVGAGPAGLAAAWELERAGASVLVLDGQDSPGGRARWGEGEMWLAGTSTQREQGQQDDPARALGDWERVTGAAPDPWVERYLREAPTEVHDWLLTLGVRFGKLERDTRSGQRRLHYPQGGSPALVEALLAALDLEPRTGTWVTDLVIEQGRVQGVVVQGSRPLWQLEGQPSTLRAGAVILATGSILGSDDRIRALAETHTCPVRPTYHKLGSFPGGTDLAATLEGLGVTLRSADSIGAYAHLLAEPPWPFIEVDRALWVDRSGASFFDPRQWTSIDSGRALARLPGCEGWAVFDDRHADQVLALLDEQGRAAALARGEALFRAEDAVTLARQAGLDAAGLEATVATAQLAPGPLWAARLGLSVGKSFGGVPTDLTGRVLGADGEPIPGLYAAGELCGMAGGSLAAPDGLDGSLGAVMLSGRVAGRSAADARR